MTAKALENCALTVHISTKLNRSHLIHGRQALLLPCLGRTELDQQASGKQFVSVENSMGVVHRSQGVLAPCSAALKSEAAIVAGIAQATLGERTRIDWAHMVSHYDHIRNAIENTIPGFENYNQRVRQPGGFYLPNGPREGRFDTPDGKAHFSINQPASTVLAKDEFLMITNRSHDQFNTTIYGLDDRYRGIHNERRVVLVNRDDMRRHGLQERQVVDLESRFQGETRRVHRFLVVPYDVPEQCVMTYFPEANALVPLKQQAHTSKTPASKSVVVRILPHGEPARG
jgi:anaerobic selenocysteine-containing dehydrogenase